LSYHPFFSGWRSCKKPDFSGKIRFFKAISEPAKTVIPTKVGIQNMLKLLDSGFRRNDEDGLLQLALSKNLSTQPKIFVYQKTGFFQKNPVFRKIYAYLFIR